MVVDCGVGADLETLNVADLFYHAVILFDLPVLVMDALEVFSFKVVVIVFGLVGDVMANLVF